ncbi:MULTISPECIES: PD-(D/E)XK nuclease family protein [Cyanophyceae]|uniref:PDDEXK-like family protein n=1 Tax=Cyanophyceae TaxID=3028117 RepID=UPI001686E386|nr:MULTISPECIES: PD-(D/E)XK nuclease family protein [Cyanophyceae]MBD1914389.1 PD-(D/E)XK nuclease family protein [Phormidium sp. FACHB-77]MBD2029968.1 PD-(D/E)XK nuclease family protein [Phormidium sp. FACHB-322]MBD2049946.1 PD-(D/E)XK nuclease family protein [Leptolyngbya sp. FACHB-60]
MPLSQKFLLEQFVVDNEDLERLESLLDQFNIFEAVGMVRQEIRHSHFFAFLLNPSASHRLGDIFLKAFLKRLLIAADNAPVSPVDIDISDLADAEVRREWRNIDVLLISPANQIVCAIENKVDSGEHSNQLQRYRQIVQKEFQNYRHIFVYLTLEGISPYGKNDQQHWLAYSYADVAQLIDDLAKRYQSTIGSEVNILMTHYSSLIRRHFMEESEIAKLCRKIYSQHQEALDLIYEHRPNLESEVFEYLKSLVKHTTSEKIVLNHAWLKHKVVGFAVPNWDKYPFQKTCKGWSSTNRILLFEFALRPPEVKLVLTLGPGDHNNRQAIYDSLVDHKISGFVESQPSSENRWLCLISMIASEKLGPDSSLSEISEDIDKFWQQFLAHELPRINSAIDKGLSLGNQTTAT